VAAPEAENRVTAGFLLGGGLPQDAQLCGQRQVGLVKFMRRRYIEVTTKASLLVSCLYRRRAHSQNFQAILPFVSQQLRGTSDPSLRSR